MDNITNSTNKSQRPLGNKFDVTSLNKLFEEKDAEDEKKNVKVKKNVIKNNVVSILPHQRSMEDIIVSCRELFFKILELLIDKQNPIPYIFSSDVREFSFALFLIVIGFVLLLFSNIMKSSD